VYFICLNPINSVHLIDCRLKFLNVIVFRSNLWQKILYFWLKLLNLHLMILIGQIKLIIILLYLLRKLLSLCQILSFLCDFSNKRLQIFQNFILNTWRKVLLFLLTIFIVNHTSWLKLCRVLLFLFVLLHKLDIVKRCIYDFLFILHCLSIFILIIFFNFFLFEYLQRQLPLQFS